MLERRASRLTLLVRSPSYRMLPSVRIQRSSESVSELYIPMSRALEPYGSGTTHLPTPSTAHDSDALSGDYFERDVLQHFRSVLRNGVRSVVSVERSATLNVGRDSEVRRIEGYLLALFKPIQWTAHGTRNLGVSRGGD